MASRTTTVNERLEYVRENIADKPKDLATYLEVDQATIYRYKRHIELGVPLSGNYSGRSSSRGKKLAAAKKLAEPTLEERVARVEDGLEKEKAARFQTTDSLLELTLNMVNLQDKLAEVKARGKRFFGY